MKKTIVAAVISTTFLGGCTHLATNEQPSTFRSEVKPVMTEHSLGLACLGDLIDQSDKPAMTIFVNDIDDETVPRRFRDRRLSHGGAWWFHTAVGKIRSGRVKTSLASPTPANHQAGQHLVLSGAWTQDDYNVGNNRKGIDLVNKGRGYLESIGWGRSQRNSVIAGDFVSSVNGTVIHASAISVAISNSRNGLDLQIDDGSRSLELGFSGRVNEGPQFAQRRIAEAAVLVHVARAFNIDYRDCVDQEWSRPDHFREKTTNYLAKSAHEQHKLVQQALVRAGYTPGPIDGQWGRQSANSLAKFQSEHGLPATGEPSVEIYGMLLQHDLES